MISLAWRPHNHGGSPKMRIDDQAGDPIYVITNASANDRGTWIGDTTAITDFFGWVRLKGRISGAAGGQARILQYVGSDLVSNDRIAQGAGVFEGRAQLAAGITMIRVDLRLWNEAGAASFADIVLEEDPNADPEPDPDPSPDDAAAEWFDPGLPFALNEADPAVIPYALWSLEPEDVITTKIGGQLGIYSDAGGQVRITAPVPFAGAAVQGTLRILSGPATVAVRIGERPLMTVTGKTIGRGWYQFTAYHEAPGAFEIAIDIAGGDGPALIDLAPIVAYRRAEPEAAPVQLLSTYAQRRRLDTSTT